MTAPPSATERPTASSRLRPVLVPILGALLLLAVRRGMRMYEFWQLWHSGAGMSFPREAEYHFWVACGGLLSLLASAMLLLMIGRRRLRDVWLQLAVSILLAVASGVAVRHADALWPY